MTIRIWIIFAAAVLLALFGCTDLTEFDHALKAGINIISPQDLSVVHTIEDLSGARSLCALPDCFIVATTEGTVFRFDLESYRQTGFTAIGNPSPSAYFDMEYCPTENTVYIIGALGQIVELSVPDLEFMDSFIVCETPVDIEMAPEKPFFYVAGASSRGIYEVSNENNAAGRHCILASSPTCMAIDQCQDTILVGTMGETELVSTGSDVMRRRAADYFPGILAIKTIPDINDDTRLCAVFDFSTGTIATIRHYFPSGVGGSCWVGTVPVGGDFHYICTDSTGSHAYVLSYLGNSTSKLVSYNCTDYCIEGQITLQGYPFDLEMSSGGMLLVLTAE